MYAPITKTGPSKSMPGDLDIEVTGHRCRLSRHKPEVESSLGLPLGLLPFSRAGHHSSPPFRLSFEGDFTFLGSFAIWASYHRVVAQISPGIVCHHLSAPVWLMDWETDMFSLQMASVGRESESGLFLLFRSFGS